MSIKSWKKEFYPITARQAAEQSRVRATEHSLRKWIGLRKSNLNRHELFVGDYESDIQDENESFPIRSISCALCEKFDQGKNCTECPLFESRGGVRCDSPATNSPFTCWTLDNNPAPMIKALRKALKWAKENS